MKKIMMLAAVLFVMCSFLSPKADAAPVGLFDGTVDDINANLQSSGAEDISLKFSYIADNPDGGAIYGDSLSVDGENIDIYVYCNTEKRVDSITLKMPQKQDLAEASKTIMTFLVHKGMQIDDTQVSEVVNNAQHAIKVDSLSRYIHFLPSKIDNDFAIVICASNNGNLYE